MSKLRAALSGLGLALVALAVPAQAVALGPDAAACAPGAAGPAMLVRIEGLKARSGDLRVQVYGGDPKRYFEKGTYLRRIDLPVPADGVIEVCAALPRPGTYAVSVRHDVDGSGKTGLNDGGGMSGNPHLSLIDVMLRHKPPAEAVAVRVGAEIARVPVVLNYVHGGTFGPIAPAAG